MGRRLKSTKSGKFMNPTDQARKEARKRELKKNKKQRTIVRAAVLKGKDPYQIISDLERLDKMEYDYYNTPSLNEKVLKDKRRKLRETWDRVCRLYIKEDKDKYLELKRMEGDYEAKRNELIKQYEAIKSAHEVNVDEIPLPSMIEPPTTSTNSVPVSILKNGQKNSTKMAKQPPGCPPGLPPSMKELLGEVSDDDDDDDDNSESEESLENEQGSEERKTKIRFANDLEDEKKNKGDNSAGGPGDLEKFLQEIERLSSDTTKKTTGNVDVSQEKQKLNETPAPAPPRPLSTSVKPPPVDVYLHGTASDSMSWRHRPPPLSTGSVISTQGVLLTPSGFVRFNGPPPPPPPPQFSGNQASSSSNQNPKKQAATIEARPQLRNLSADSTKFMPLALRVRREEKLSHHQQSSRKPINRTVDGFGMVHHHSYNRSTIANQTSTKTTDDKTNTKDDAYERFMQEMNGLI